MLLGLAFPPSPMLLLKDTRRTQMNIGDVGFVCHSLLSEPQLLPQTVSCQKKNQRTSKGHLGCGAVFATASHQTLKPKPSPEQAAFHSQRTSGSPKTSASLAQPQPPTLYPGGRVEDIGHSLRYASIPYMAEDDGVGSQTFPLQGTPSRTYLVSFPFRILIIHLPQIWRTLGQKGVCHSVWSVGR